MSDARRLCRAAAFLLRYPDREWKAAVEELAHDARALGLATPDRARLSPFMAWAASSDLLDLQASYVETFDLGGETPLHVTALVFGEERDRARTPQRGFGLSQLAEAYRAAGFEVAGGELPDFLPAILEFLAETGATPGFRPYLRRLVPPVGILAERLLRRESPYAPVVLAAHDAMNRLA